MIFNIGNSDPLFDLSVSGYPGATVTITDGKKTYEKVTDSEGNAVFEKLKRGTWNATAKDGSISIPYEVEIGRDCDNALNINAIPEFTYDGSYQIVDDNDKPISYSLRDWKIRFLTVGTKALNITHLNGAAKGIDVFCVGGGGNGGTGTAYSEQNDLVASIALGGGGGAGGFTTTQLGVTVKETAYDITVGGASGTTKAFGVTANGGGNGGSPWYADYNDGTSNGPFRYFVGGNGGNGGSGGGAGSDYTQTSGGTDGNNGGGSAHNSDFYHLSLKTGKYGQGQRSLGKGATTKEFGESKGKLYASGGKGGTANSSGTAGSANTGNGGSGGGVKGGGAGGSGIVIIRNKRKEESE